MSAGVSARLAVAHLKKQGVDPAPLLRQVGLSENALSKGNHIPARCQMELLGLASSVLKDNCIGLTLAADADLRSMGALYYVAASSECLVEALHRLGRYVRVANEALELHVATHPTC